MQAAASRSTWAGLARTVRIWAGKPRRVGRAGTAREGPCPHAAVVRGQGERQQRHPEEADHDHDRCGQRRGQQRADSRAEPDRGDQRQCPDPDWWHRAGPDVALGVAELANGAGVRCVPAGLRTGQRALALGSPEQGTMRGGGLRIRRDPRRRRSWRTR